MQKPHTPNSLLESDIKEAFEDDPMLDHSRIVVKVNDERVRLTGAVASFEDVERATKDVRLVAGSKPSTTNCLSGPAERGSPIEVAKACALALEADRIIPTGSVTVEVKDGYVALFGKVRNHSQRIAAEHAVGRVDGVLGVTALG